MKNPAIVCNLLIFTGVLDGIDLVDQLDVFLIIHTLSSAVWDLEDYKKKHDQEHAIQFLCLNTLGRPTCKMNTKI